MGTTVKRILEIARKEIGVTEYPANSNKVKYNTAYYGREVFGAAYPWCCAFIWWLFQQAEAKELFFNGGKTASCTTLMNYYKKQKQFKISNPHAGDLVFFNFDKNTADAEHIGIVESVNGGIIITIEGNTGTTNDANGGAVMRRERRASVILGYATPAYDEEKVGWIQEGKHWWYRHENGSYTRDAWERIDNKWYYFDKDGWMVTGWLKKDDIWYYLKSDGSMAENEILVIYSEKFGKETYAFDKNGCMFTQMNSRGALI